MEKLNVIDVITEDQLKSYFKYLINRTYKILPLKEESLKTGEKGTFIQYVKGYKMEIEGFQFLFDVSEEDPKALTLMSYAEYLSNSDYSHEDCKYLVFKCINILKSIGDKYLNG